MADINIDLKGVKCPMPIFKLSQELDKMAVGQTIEVLADDPAFKPDVEAFCSMRKHDLLSITEDEGVFIASIKK